MEEKKDEWRQGDEDINNPADDSGPVGDSY